ncbi:MAG: phosphate ABC transporter substrate-binding protein PstS [Pegethrix bostrychoides GSE-TBD4-15B]|jgi:phosphate transport system substrate-binding protein|uniref:Phosphate-binding protein n=1 Tax=Pegethrix bostrychoides GSE-TBD4-15B TaxID=2839662 RepID=A0A951U6R2_9CYAN|nr:phosphate ABC transporter substrate-binding protein PstS [Pegethrix bostrychoides GSE-TBD4-15B]
MKPHLQRVILFLSALTLTVSITACLGGQPSGERPETSVELKLPFTDTIRATGAGASFPAPLYQGWFRNFNSKIPQMQFNYQSTGSGAGIERFTNNIVDFGASDIAMTDEQIAKIDRGVILLPMTAGSIVMAYNLPDIKDMKLSREAYIDIFLGKITNWNDPKIAATNPGVTFPNQPITVAHRSDGSGTTAIFTSHLAEVSPEWKQSIGTATTVQWPSGSGKTFIGARGNEGVTALVSQTVGAIGYLEYGFATKSNLSFATLENKAGKFVTPNSESGAEALAQVELPDNLRVFITDPPGDGSYPIVTYTWMMLYKKYDDPNKAIAMEAMVQYGLTDGQKQAAPIGYIALPPNVIKRVAAAADEITPDFTIKLE